MEKQLKEREKEHLVALEKMKQDILMEKKTDLKKLKEGVAKQAKEAEDAVMNETEQALKDMQMDFQKRYEPGFDLLGKFDCFRNVYRVYVIYKKSCVFDLEADIRESQLPEEVEL
jgi:hypothetical protein